MTTENTTPTPAADDFADIATFSPTHPDLNTAAEQPAAKTPAAPDKAAATAEEKKAEDAKVSAEADSDKPNAEVSDAARKLRASRSDVRKQKIAGEIAEEVKKREQLRRENAELAKQNEALKSGKTKDDTAGKTAPTDDQIQPTRPKPVYDDEQYATYEDFVEDLSDWKDEQREHKRQIEAERAEVAKRQKADEDAADAATAEEEEILAASKERTDAYTAQHPDFADLLEKTDLTLHRAVMRELHRSPYGQPIIHGLLKDAEDAKAFCALSPVDQLKEIGRREDRIATGGKAPKREATTPSKPISKAPAPVTPVGGPSAPAKSLEDMDTDDYLDAMNAKERQGYRR